MDVPISLAILMAAAVSLRETSLSGPRAYFEAAIMLTFFLLVGRYLAHRTRAAARSAAAELAALEVQTADRLLPDGRRETVPLDALRPGDLIAVAPGARIPADGTVTAGRSEVDPSLLTGETLPQPVAPGATVSAGMLNLTGPLTLTRRARSARTRCSARSPASSRPPSAAAAATPPSPSAPPGPMRPSCSSSPPPPSPGGARPPATGASPPTSPPPSSSSPAPAASASPSPPS